MEKKLIYQRPSLNGLNDDASGLCQTGSSASGFVINGILCNTGTAAGSTSDILPCTAGTTDAAWGYQTCTSGTAYTTNASSCNTGGTPT